MKGGSKVPRRGFIAQREVLSLKPRDREIMILFKKK